MRDATGDERRVRAIWPVRQVGERLFPGGAYLTEEAGERFANGARIGRMGRNAPGTRKSGEQLWLIGFVAAFGGADGMIQELREKLFEGRKIKTLQPAPEGSWVGVMEW
jgi:hemolysin-activating ACP:hemolysin acyltransferase